MRSEGQRGKTARPKKRHRGRDREVRIWKQNTEASGHRKPGRSNDLLLVTCPRNLGPFRARVFRRIFPDWEERGDEGVNRRR